MEAVSKQICKIRRTVCPKTSYSSGGSGATKLLVFEGDATEEFRSKTWADILASIINQKEFDESQSFSSLEDLIQFGPVGHVICVVGVLDKSVLTKLLTIVDGRRSSLLFEVRRIPDSGEDDESSDEENEGAGDVDQTRAKKKENMKINKSKLTFSKIGVELITWQVRTSRMTISSAAAASVSGAPALGTAFNGQPGVWTKQQFRYLWGILDGFKPSTENEAAKLDEARRRVLQRLSTKPVLGGKKLSVEQWDELIRKALVEENRHDFGIYSLIREKTLGKGISESLRSSASSSSSGMGGTDDTDDGRSDHLVDATLECIPAALREQPQRYFKSLLDYGCAEGAITSTLGQRLKLKPENIYGADVRSISSRDFTYVQLAAEDPVAAPTTTGTILPSVADRSISVVNCAMVFHHVIHTKAIMKELRRIIDATNGLLIIREHDCRDAPTAAFLDILHGLFSLAWKDPIEWPNFIAEYKAYYRSREDWTSLLQECGFKLHASLPSSYFAAENSTFKDGRCFNVTRAYYAVYIPDWAAEKRTGIPMSAEAHAISKGQQTAVLQPATTIGRKRPASMISHEEVVSGGQMNTSREASTVLKFDPKISTPAQIIAHAAKMAHEEYEVYESTSQPGKFFKFYPANGRKEWFYFL